MTWERESVGDDDIRWKKKEEKKCEEERNRYTTFPRKYLIKAFDPKAASLPFLYSADVIFVCLSSVHPMLCSSHDIGCDEDKQTNVFFSTHSNYSMSLIISEMESRRLHHIICLIKGHVPNVSSHPYYSRRNKQPFRDRFKSKLLLARSVLGSRSFRSGFWSEPEPPAFDLFGLFGPAPVSFKMTHIEAKSSHIGLRYDP